MQSQNSQPPRSWELGSSPREHVHSGWFRWGFSSAPSFVALGNIGRSGSPPPGHYRVFMFFQCCGWSWRVPSAWSNTGAILESVQRSTKRKFLCTLFYFDTGIKPDMQWLWTYPLPSLHFFWLTSSDSDCLNCDWITTQDWMANTQLLNVVGYPQSSLICRLCASVHICSAFHAFLCWNPDLWNRILGRDLQSRWSHFSPCLRHVRGHRYPYHDLGCVDPGMQPFSRGNRFWSYCSRIDWSGDPKAHWEHHPLLYHLVAMTRVSIALSGLRSGHWYLFHFWAVAPTSVRRMCLWTNKDTLRCDSIV